MRRIMFLAAFAVLTSAVMPSIASAAAAEMDPYEMLEAFSRFPFAKIIPLDEGKAWGLIYADVYGKVYLKRATDSGWKREWELTNLGARVRRFFVQDADGDGVTDIIIASVSGRILVYSMANYVNTWENLEDNFASIEAFEIGNVDSDPQMEFVMIADGTMYIVDSVNKTRQWISERTFQASELIIANVDTDPQPEIILNTGIVIDSKFRNIELEWDRPFGERIMVFDMNSDGHLEVVGEFSDYSLRIFDIYSEREVW